MAEAIEYAFGNDTVGAPMLKPCAHCGAVADYVRVKALPPLYHGIKVVCSGCGLQTDTCVNAHQAGEAWNARQGAARVVTLQEIMEFKGGHVDEEGACPCWVETIEGELRAALLHVCASMDGREVHEWGAGWEREWERAEIDAEGVRFRCWTAKPTAEDRQREPWGRVAWHGGISEKADEQARALYRKFDEQRRIEAERRAEAARRRCAWCAQMSREVPEGATLAEQIMGGRLVCARDGHTITAALTQTCEAWRDNRQEAEA